MSKADFATRESIANLIINRVKLYPNKAIIEGIVPVVPDVLSSAHRGAPPTFNLYFVSNIHFPQEFVLKNCSIRWLYLRGRWQGRLRLRHAGCRPHRVRDG